MENGGLDQPALRHCDLLAELVDRQRVRAPGAHVDEDARDDDVYLAAVEVGLPDLLGGELADAVRRDGVQHQVLCERRLVREGCIPVLGRRAGEQNFGV